MEGQRNSIPRDSFNLVYIILLIHGIGTLMPWNMFINAESYFRSYKLSQNNTILENQDDINKLNDIRENFIPYLSNFAQVPNVLFNGLNLLVQMGSGNLKIRVNLTLIIEAIIFTCTIVLAYIDSSKWPLTFFYITMLSVVILNMASGIYQNCIFGTGAKFPSKFTNAILIGSNFSGTFTSIVNLITIWSAPDPRQSAIAYFVTSLFIIMICLISYNLLPLIPFYEYHDKKTGNDSNQQVTVIGDGTQLELVEKDAPLLKQKQQQTALGITTQNHPNQEQKETSDLMKKWQVLKKCWPQCLNVFLVFFVTLTLFPAILADIKETGDFFTPKYFSATACFFVFNLSTMLGNILSTFTTWPVRKWPVLITNDWIYIVGNFLFALSSGYLSSLCMMFVSSDLPPDQAPKAGMLGAFFLVFGIFVGVNSPFLLKWFVKQG